MTTTMHFGPEWMRTKQQMPSRPQPPPSPPPHTSGLQPNASTYSALVSPMPPTETEKRDETHPFRYSKEEMLRIYKEGGGKGGLGLEVERWEGVVRENGSDPVGLREIGDGEKKLFAGPLNSELRRRQSTDYLSLNTSSHGGDRQRMNHNSANPGSPMRERFGSFMGKRRDSTDPPTLPIPRKLSLSSGQGPLSSPRDAALPSPRTRMGGFDGVLSSGESWMARRKAAEGLSKPTGAPKADVGEGENTAVHIKEEEEEPNIQAIDSSEDTSAQSGVSQNHEPSGDSRTQAVSQAMGDLSLRNNGHLDPGISSGNPAPAAMASSPPMSQPIQDLANVEWSYLDPQGNVQGPFVASTMQKWHDDGYFTPDLLMKRTNTDTEWIPVGELARRANGAKIFLSPLIPANVPPGLSRRTDSPMQSFATPNENSYNTPFQPVPLRTLRTSTLDSYLGSSSNPSDSPSSSFGAGRFSNGSPDPSAFGGRIGGNFYTGDPSIGTRMTGFPTGPGPAFTQNRGALNESLDSSLGMRNAAFGNVAPGRASSVDNYGFNGGYNPNQTPWPASDLNSTGSTFDSANAGHPVDSMMPYNSNYDSSRTVLNGASVSQFGQSGAFGNSHIPQDAAFVDNSVGFATGDYNAVGISGNPTQNPNIGFGNFASRANHTAFTEQSQQSPTMQYSQPTPSSQATVIDHPQMANPPQQSPWNNVEPVPVRRSGPGPFDANHPKATNIVVNNSGASAQALPWGVTGQTSKPTSVNNDASPWYTASQTGATDDRWRETPGPNSLTFDNVGVHNQQLETPESDAITPSAEVTIESQPPSPAVPPAQSSTEPTPRDPSPPVTAPQSKSKRKATSQQNQTSLATTKTPPAPTVSDPSPTTAAVKPAWATEDDPKKPKSSGAGLGLREIQEAEAKKLEARKAAERERERAARAVTSASPVSEDTQSFTASWGLPTSRAGGRNDSLPKESVVTNSASPQTSSAPVWTNTGKVPQAKKSMKEIQEEEERRKKLGVKETVASAAARRGYAETMNKVAPSPQPTGGAWTTVGATGKATVTAATPIRPAVTTPVTSFSPAGPSAPRVNGPSTSRPTTISKSSVTPKVEDAPVAPSHDFLKWLSDSLKGLNTSVNVEDIVSMLLSFPLDPDPSTVELISDTIYSNSTTLDGRRFASEFVSKRKADAASKRSVATSGKPVSIADVVRTQPKPTQPEWGGFKVVNKKKRGGRS